MSSQISTLRSLNSKINAVVEFLPVPEDAKFVFSVKDSIEVAGCRCTAGTWGYRDRPPATRDATIVARLLAMGGAPIARANCPDLLFAFETDNLIWWCGVELRRRDFRSGYK